MKCGEVGMGRCFLELENFLKGNYSISTLFAYRNILNGEIHVASLTGCGFIVATPPSQF